jgi:hypothetical protein
MHFLRCFGSVFPVLVLLVCGLISNAQDARTGTPTLISVPATTYTFTSTPGQFGNNWSQADKWSPSYPGDHIAAGDSAYINSPNVETVIGINVVIDGNLFTVPATNTGNALRVAERVSLTFNSGSVFTNDGSFGSFLPGGLVRVRDGAHVINNGSLNVGDLILESGGTITNGPNGTILFTGKTMTGDLANYTGTVTTTHQTDTINGNFSNGDGIFLARDSRIETSPYNVGKLNVIGEAQLSGTFDFTYFIRRPVIGEEITILSAGSRTGTFTNRSISLGDGSFANIHYTQTTAFLTIDKAPLPATASVSGIVKSAEGRGITNATVTLSDASGLLYTTITDRRGSFRLDNIPAGVTYTVTVSQGRYTFDSQIVELNDNATALTFTGIRVSK